MNSDKHRYFRQRSAGRVLRSIVFAVAAIFFYLWLIFLPSCSAKPTNLRALAPADSLIYLETNDLGVALQPIIDSRPFTEVAKKKPDLSALRGVQLAVAVTGFETKEEKLNEENSIGRIQPHFAAIADTHAWNWQTRNFTENQLGEFINNIYGGGVNLDTSPKNGGVSYVWTAEDGRKAYAFVDGSLIFFGNDESSIDKCLAVRRGEGDSILKNPKMPQAEPGALAQGYISTDGVAQIANIAGIAMAAQTGEAESVKSFIASALPGILRSSVSDASWTASRTELGIEDKWLISTAPDVTNVFSETMAPLGSGSPQLFEYLPPDLPSITAYSLKDPQRAWRSVILSAQKQADPAVGKILAEFSGTLFEPYGIRDIEGFLNAAGPSIVTAKFDLEGNKPVVLAVVNDKEKLRKTLASDLKPNKQLSDELGSEALRSDDGDAAVFIDDKIIAGDADSVTRCVKAKQSGENFAKTDAVKKLIEGKAASITLGSDPEIAARIAEAFDVKKSEDAASPLSYSVETKFTKSGIERRTVSAVGLIGTIIAQLAPEE